METINEKELVSKEHTFIENIADDLDTLAEFLCATYEEYLTNGRIEDHDKWCHLTTSVRIQISMMDHICEMLAAFSGRKTVFIDEACEIMQAKREIEKEFHAQLKQSDYTLTIKKGQ